MRLVLLFSFLITQMGAQTTSKVLVDGKPPLTESLIDSYFDYMEWVSERPTTYTQRRELREILTLYWKDALRTGREMVALADSVSRLSAAVSASQGDPRVRRVSTAAAWIEALQAVADNPVGQRHLKWFLELCGNCASGAPPAAVAAPMATASAVNVPTMLYAHDGSFGAQGGINLVFALLPNGQYGYTGTHTGVCRLGNEGRYTLQNDVISFQPDKVTLNERADSCLRTFELRRLMAHAPKRFVLRRIGQGYMMNLYLEDASVGSGEQAGKYALAAQVFNAPSAHPIGSAEWYRDQRRSQESMSDTARTIIENMRTCRDDERRRGICN